jgi:hypothetical protein
MIPYKMQIVQTLHDRDKDRRVAFVVDLLISWNQILIFLSTCMEMRSMRISRRKLTNKSVEYKEQNIQTSTRCSTQQSGVFSELLHSWYWGLEDSANSEQYGGISVRVFFFIFQRTGWEFGSLDSVVGTGTSYEFYGPPFESRQGRELVSAPEPSIPPLRPTQPSIRWVPGDKRPGHEGEDSPVLSAEVKSEYNYTCTHPIFPRGVDYGSFILLPIWALIFYVDGAEFHFVCTPCCWGGLRRIEHVVK